MATKHMVSLLTAQNATETTATQVDSIVVPQGVKKLVAVATQISTAGLTTLEDVTGILEITSDDASPWAGTQQFLMNAALTAVTSGAVALQPFYHVCDIVVQAGSHLKLTATYNKAQTINPSTRVGLVFE